MNVNSSQFYVEIIGGNRPIKEIFAELSTTMNSHDFDELLEEFSFQLKENFDANEKEEIRANKPFQFKLPQKVAKRVRLTMMLLSLLVMGASFNEEVFFDSIDFLLKKELCSASIILN